MDVRARVVTVSDRTARGERDDRSGPVAVAALTDAGFADVDAFVIPDGADDVERALREALAAGVRLVVTTGGTGVSPRDETPEGTARVIDRELPGIAEELRRRDTLDKPHGMLTRGLVGTASTALIVNLPGSPAAVATGMPVVLSVSAHVLDQLDGGDH